MVHISELAHRRVARVDDVVKMGDEVVKVIDVDPQGKIKLTRKGSEPEEGEEAAPPQAPRGERPGGGPQRLGRQRPAWWRSRGGSEERGGAGSDRAPGLIEMV